MRDPSWMGTFPSGHFWSANSKQIYFKYNPEKNLADSLYKIEAISGAKPSKVLWSEEKTLKKEDVLSSDESLKLFKKGNQVLLEDVKKGKTTTLFDYLVTPIKSPNHNPADTPVIISDFKARFQQHQQQLIQQHQEKQQMHQRQSSQSSLNNQPIDNVY
jgi:hypothetical protein